MENLFKRKIYVDVNILLGVFDFKSFKILSEEEIRNRQISLARWEYSKSSIFVISKTVFIEWVNKVITTYRKDSTFNQFRKTKKFNEIFFDLNNLISAINSNKKFRFEWKINELPMPSKDTWDFFHVVMKRRKRWKFVSFDKRFNTNKKHFFFLKK